MVSLFDGYNHILRLDRGERLSDVMRDFLANQDLLGAWVSGIGGVTEVELGFYDLQSREYRWRTVIEPLEITSLSGSIARDDQDKPTLHLHGTFGNEQYVVIGGHVKDFVVGGTCELFLHHTFKPLRRSHDDSVGLNTLAL